MEKAIHQTPPILLRQDRGVVSILNAEPTRKTQCSKQRTDLRDHQSLGRH
jgi:hypothetical protein